MELNGQYLMIITIIIIINRIHFSIQDVNKLKNSVQLSHSVLSKSLQPHGLQHSRLHCLSLFLGVWSNSCPLSRWCHSTISSSVIPCSSCLQSFPASGLFQRVGSSHQVAKVLELQLQHLPMVFPMNIQGWFPLGLTGLVSLLSRDSQESSLTPQFESINSLALSFLYSPTLTSIHGYWKNHSQD